MPGTQYALPHALLSLAVDSVLVFQIGLLRNKHPDNGIVRAVAALRFLLPFPAENRVHDGDVRHGGGDHGGQPVGQVLPVGLEAHQGRLVRAFRPVRDRARPTFRDVGGLVHESLPEIDRIDGIDGTLLHGGHRPVRFEGAGEVFPGEIRHLAAFPSDFPRFRARGGLFALSGLDGDRQGQIRDRPMRDFVTKIWFFELF